jgi:hypothetical membrane protein
MRSTTGRRALAMLVLFGVVAFWLAVLLAADANTGYEHRRDYVSTLASRGAEHGWLGVLAIVSAAAAMIAAGILVAPLSGAAAISVGSAGAGFLVVAFTRLQCANGAAGCGLGGRLSVSGATEVTHWAATTVSTVLVIIGMVVTGLGLLRVERALAGSLTLAAAATTAGAFLMMGGQSPGGIQRVGILVATGWLAALAVAGLKWSPSFGKS